jgi:transposase
MRTIINEEVCKRAKECQTKMGKIGTVSKKLQAIISSHKHGIKKVSEVLGVSKASIYLWSKQLQKGDFDSLINKSKHQDGIKVKREHKEAIKEWLTLEPNLSIIEVKDRLKYEFGIDVSRSTAHRAIKSSGFSYITGRKQHYKQDKTMVKNFKKPAAKTD